MVAYKVQYIILPSIAAFIINSKDVLHAHVATEIKNPCKFILKH